MKRWDTETIKELVKRLQWHYPHSYSVCNTIQKVANEMMQEEKKGDTECVNTLVNTASQEHIT